ncbi:hypothetical protein A2290_02350 [candidate division WOR-1 bacterium RIFOXYB2_FULL_36_35]|uniref:DUF6434 domain-containing protein n=1 Tax=candidate division WOR-1 bacterium RIFOXYB2_FULL_36_35 TaxID=1802578 RepID=A0A1F4S0Q0_UNCSA|nr:MAG: hypothetical protein A2290_02350 [candidate division WOR-1 bacterium RIFOXYB2_FULL_36_35]OGC14947.1 MAG: hypothetical protein A2282_06885 [candidate division WOR-1 bacterium RIFOXYA12_FULL_36_13]
MNKRPILNKNISFKDFNNWYFEKDELVNFCRDNGLKITGQKLDIKARVENFLKTGESHQAPIENNKKTKEIKQTPPKSINEEIPDNYTSSELYRKYFKSVIGPHFHFTAYMMKHMKEHPKMTFKDYINEWIAEYERRKDKSYKPQIMKSCEYNQYIRDFFSDNPTRKLKEAIQCWKYKRNLPGNNKYTKDDLRILNVGKNE